MPVYVRRHFPWLESWFGDSPALFWSRISLLGRIMGNSVQTL